MSISSVRLETVYPHSYHSWMHSRTTVSARVVVSPPPPTIVQKLISSNGGELLTKVLRFAGNSSSFFISKEFTILTENVLDDLWETIRHALQSNPVVVRYIENNNIKEAAFSSQLSFPATSKLKLQKMIELLQEKNPERLFELNPTARIFDATLYQEIGQALEIIAEEEALERVWRHPHYREFLWSDGWASFAIMPQENASAAAIRNFLSTIPPDHRFFTELENIQWGAYFFDDTKIFCLPVLAREFTHVASINITGNSLLSLPSWIGSFPNLKVLEVSRNELQFLPVEIGNLELEELHVADNSLQKIPHLTESISSLRTLNLGHNLLQEFPVQIIQMRNLTELDLGGNKMSYLPHAIWNLTQLSVLNVGLNALRTLPDTIGKLSELTELVLSGNALESLPDEIADLGKLKKLRASSNRIGSLPLCALRLPPTTSIDLQVNLIEHLPDNFKPEQFPNIDLTCNPVTMSKEEAKQCLEDYWNQPTEEKKK